MWVHVLGSAAGGGFPQWNCACSNCAGVRSGAILARRRRQACVALSADRERWFIVNTGAEVHLQIEACEPLWPRGKVRHSPIAAVLLTDAELDHTAGLLSLRQADSLQLYATDFVFRALTEWNTVLRTLASCCPVERRVVRLGEDFPLDAALTGLAFSAHGRKAMAWAPEHAPSAEAVVGYRITDTRTGNSLAYLPCLPALGDDVMAMLSGCTVALVDGTCWSDDELAQVGLTSRTARAMGHLPVGGPEGSLEQLARLDDTRVIYTHLNNTNPLLMEGSPERRYVEACGLEVAFDGLEIEV